MATDQIAAQPAATGEPDERFVEARGIPVHLIDRGTGIPVVALHGWMVDHHYMAGVLEPIFAAHPGYRRIYLDSPGMGRTPAPKQIASSEDMLAVVLALIDTVLGSEPFLLVGHSHGGYLARGIAHRQPEQVLGLALINPMPHAGESDVAPHVVVHRSGDLTGLLSPELESEYETYVVVQTPEVLRRMSAREEPGTAMADKAALERIYGSFYLAESPESGPAFTRPSLILTGRQDSWTGYAPGWTWLDHYPRASYVVLDSAGHALPHEQPDLLTALVGEWLERVARDAPA